ncbi:Eco57I restriction-modification methylase domain-containing protein [Helicobacter sp. 23-1044]
MSIQNLLANLYPVNQAHFKAFLDSNFALQNLGLASNAPLSKDENLIKNLSDFDFANAIIYATNADREGALKPSEKTNHKNLAFTLIELQPNSSLRDLPTANRGNPKSISHKKADLIRATRAINSAIPSYNIIFFVSPTHLSIAFATRRFHAKRIIHTDIIQKITLIKDIDLAHPSHAHCKNLVQIAQIKPKEVDIYYSEILETLSISSLNKAFYKEIFAHFADFVENLTLPNTSDEQTKRDFVLRLFSRILFCKFLEKKSIIDSAIWDSALSANYYHEVLEPLFFTTLNTPKDSRDYGFLPTQITSLLSAIPYLNGGLFSPQDNDFYDSQNPNVNINSLHISNALFSELFATLNRYHFTIDEADESAEEVALDPELLGQIFESLLSQLFTDNKLEKLDKNTLRKATGSYYTPREIVRYMVRSAILSHLQTTLKDKVDSQFLENLVFDKTPTPKSPPQGRGLEFVSPSLAEVESTCPPSLAEGARGWVNPKDSALILQELSTLKILDPACGSGAFPMGILSEIIRLQSDLGDTRPPYTRKLEILQNCIYGVDIQPMATEIVRLRCFLSLIIDEDFSHSKEPNPLPNLEFKFISANSLLPLQTSLQDSRGRQLGSDIYEKGLIELQQIRAETFTSHDKIALQSKYKATIDKIAKDLFFEAQGEMPLTKWNPFNPNDIAQFFDSAYMFGVESFDIVIGNPPYIRQESIPNKQAILSAFADFACSTADIYTYFFAKAIDLLAPQGILTYIVSNKFARAGYGKNLRSLLLRHTIESYTDFNGIKIFENAIVDSCILQVSKSAPQGNQIRYAKDLSSKNCDCIPQDCLNAEAFIFVDSHTLALKQKIEKIGTPLKEWDIEIYRGVLTGYNEAFIIDSATKEAILDSCDNSIKSPLPCGGGLGVGLTERERTEQIIKPILRGRDIKRYSYEWANLWLINTHNGYTSQNGKQIQAIDINDYLTLKKYLDNFYPKLEKRTDKGATPYNLRNCAYLEDFEKEKIVWAEMTKESCFIYDTSGFFINQTCYFIPNANKYLLALLNSKLIYFYMQQIASGLGDGAFRWIKQYIEKLPIPNLDSKEKQKIADEIVNLVDKILESKSQGKDTTQLQSQINSLIYALYALDSNEIQIAESCNNKCNFTHFGSYVNQM